MFHHQIRIVKEMRERDKQKGLPVYLRRPRYMVWENVPGAFSSNGGKDFQAVLTEIVRIADPEAPDVPMPDKGKWSKSGCLYDEMGKWSVAWRVHDAQFWGVTQRRKRIALVADFGGLSAPEILFERKGLRGYLEASGTARQGAAADAANRTGAYDCERKCVGFPLGFRPENIRIYEEIATTICNGTRPGFCNGVINVYDARGNGDGQTVSTLTGDHENRITDYTSVVVEKSPVYCLQGNCIDRADTAGCNGRGWKDGVSYTLNTIDRPAVMFTMKTFGDYKDCGISSGLKARDYKDATDLVVESDGINCRNFTGAVRTEYIVRRLTPLECERLQGFPDGWTDIGEWTDSKGKERKMTDSARYKALGNSIALPFFQYLARRICAQYERDVTMASLFDGIGGFPLVFERCGAKAVWASEIDEFPMAVTKLRLPEQMNGVKILNQFPTADVAPVQHGRWIE